VCVFLCLIVSVCVAEDYQPFVPPSCCVKDRFWRYINLEACQKWRLGPPGSPVDGAVNRAIHYEVSVCCVPEAFSFIIS